MLTSTHVLNWRDQAMQDGWSSRPTYGSHEPETSAFTLEKDGFSIMGYARIRFDCSLHGWGPDKLSIVVPNEYNFLKLKENMLLCQECNNYVNHVQRVAFCNRVCDSCFDYARKKYEYSGWCD